MSSSKEQMLSVVCREADNIEEDEEGKGLLEPGGLRNAEAKPEMHTASASQKPGLEALGSRLSNLQKNIMHRQESLGGSMNMERS